MENDQENTREVIREAWLKRRIEILEAALRGLFSNPHLNLGDLVYKIRDSELKGWEGPAVTQWSEAVEFAERALNNPGTPPAAMGIPVPTQVSIDVEAVRSCYNKTAKAAAQIRMFENKLGELMDNLAGRLAEMRKTLYGAHSEKILKPNEDKKLVIRTGVIFNHSKCNIPLYQVVKEIPIEGGQLRFPVGSLIALPEGIPTPSPENSQPVCPKCGKIEAEELVIS